MNNEKNVAVLNDLLNITNDRIEGFSKVEDKVWDTHSALRNDYDQMVSESQTMKNDLIRHINEHGGEADNTTSTAGAFHRAWIDVKNAFSADKDESTLKNVVFGEKAAIDAYQNAIDNGKLSEKSREIVSEQLKHIKDSYHEFKGKSNYKE